MLLHYINFFGCFVGGGSHCGVKIPMEALSWCSDVVRGTGLVLFARLCIVACMEPHEQPPFAALCNECIKCGVLKD